LAAEATIIRREESRIVGTDAQTNEDREILRWHRSVIVRRESRLAQLAYAMLRGRSYSGTENKESAYVDEHKLLYMIERFSRYPQPKAEDLKDWLNT